jgi:hypothetical protein
VVRRNVAKLPPRHRVLPKGFGGSDRPNYAKIFAEPGMPVSSIGPTRRRGLNRIRQLLDADPESGHGRVGLTGAGRH